MCVAISFSTAELPQSQEGWNMCWGGSLHHSCSVRRGRETGEGVKRESHSSNSCSLHKTKQSVLRYMKPNIHTTHTAAHPALKTVNVVPLATGCVHILTAHHSPRLTPQCLSYHSSTEVQLIPVQLLLSQPHDHL